MKKDKIETKDGLVYFNHAWGWSPGQIVLMRQYDFDDHFIDFPVMVSKVKHQFDAPPLTTVKFVNKWFSGEWGGEIEVELMIGRYISPEPLTEKHLKAYDSHPDKKQLFYVSKEGEEFYKIYPFV